jgi:plastocyanin
VRVVFKTAGIIALCCIAVGGVAAATLLLSQHYLNNDKAKTVVTCFGQHSTHTVTIQNSVVEPDHVQASVCDRLTITNQDDQRRLMAFGEHTHHTAYDGVTERLLNKGDSVTITLDKRGSYIIHDHYQDAVEATFTVE